MIVFKRKTTSSLEKKKKDDIGEPSKMAESKDSELTSSHKHTKITRIGRTALDEQDQNIPEKIFYN